MNFIQLLFLIVIPMIWGTLEMDPTRKGNENFSSNRPIEDEDINVDSQYPGFNIHYNFEPKDWRAIELSEQRNLEFLKEINEEINRMNQDKMRMNYILNIQKEQIEELFYLTKVLQSNKNNPNDSQAKYIPQYLRNGFIENSELTKKNIQDGYDQLHLYSFNKNKYNRGNEFYYGLMDQWVQ